MNKLQARVIMGLQKTLTEPPVPNVSPHQTTEEVPQLIRKAALQTSSISATLAIPGGFTGLISVLPEIFAIWRIQAQLIANIAFLHGKSSLITKEQMLWCMFRQFGYGVLKEFVFQRGSAMVVKKMQSGAFNKLLQKLGVNIAYKQGGKWLGKFIPLAGSLSAGALSYYDTQNVGRRAEKLYQRKLLIMAEDEEPQFI